MYILGLNAFHGDSSACLLKDGKVVAAVEEERFRRIKHWAGLPTESVRYCLEEAKISFAQVEHLAINRNPKVNNWRRVAHVIQKRPDFKLILSRIRNMSKAASIEASLQSAFPAQIFRGKTHHIEHHYAHLGSAFFASEFDRAVCVSVDGFGDFASAAWGMGVDDKINIDSRVYFPHSLGIFYSALTQYIGFPHFGDEYKVMGLAPYGKATYLKQLREVVLLQEDGSYRLNLKYFRHHNENVAYSWNNCSPEVGTLFTKKLEELLGPARQKGEPLEQKHKDMAKSIQAMYEEAFFHLLNALHKRYKCTDLALSGGCAMNSVANGKVYLNTPFKRMYLPAAAGDAGGAIGSALAVWHNLTGEKKHIPLIDAYSGPGFTNTAMDYLLASKKDELTKEKCSTEKIEDLDALCLRTAKAITEGKVIGWFQGRMEWGPRALGNRSILGDPRRGDMKDILNQKIKRRESFRPFAPSILRESVSEWFEQDDDVPFMMEVFQIKKEKRSQLLAVAHVDGSGRLQTVYQSTNPRYYRLIEQFEKLTGVPMVLNTSFNENEPVVCRPQEALDCFLRTKMDVLVLNDFFIERKS
ncbi:MAG: carbamoyltransferase [Verrucomicrobiales bacterium]|nr:carbamoyltransferase [Verrucomicrobiales bacterium]